MKPFTSIESFRHTVASVKRFCTERNKPLPTIEYFGTVKLHGTNAGVRVTPEAVQPQKRSDIVSIGSDNAGFAAFCYGKDDLFRLLAKPYGNDVTFYGEWCGGAIQKGVALNQLEKHFVIFSAHTMNEDGSTVWYNAYELMVEFQNYIQTMNGLGVWCVGQIPALQITIDYRWPEASLDKLNEFTLAVENECPWGKFREVSGIGEGIVWQPVGFELHNVTDLWFKTKGGKHASKEGGKTNVAASPAKLESIKAVVDAVLPAWRLEQGITTLKDEKLAIEPQNTGAFLQWVSKDILKEENDVITANGLDWKTLVPFIMREARSWYLKKVDEEAFSA